MSNNGVNKTYTDRILNALHDGPRHSAELSRRFNYPHTSTLLSELFRQGRVVRTVDPSYTAGTRYLYSLPLEPQTVRQYRVHMAFRHSDAQECQEATLVMRTILRSEPLTLQTPRETVLVFNSRDLTTADRAVQTINLLRGAGMHIAARVTEEHVTPAYTVPERVEVLAERRI